MQPRMPTKITARSLVERRLSNQGIARPKHRRAAEVVEWLGAVQAQEFQPAKWALGLRMRNATDAGVEQAVADGEILRTHILRPTWHFVAAADLVWMQRLTGRRMQRAMEVYQRQLGLETSTLTKATALFERVLRDGQYLTRVELAERLLRANLPLSGIRLAHAAMYAEFEAVICSGPRTAKRSTYALVAERAPTPRELSGDEALGELTRRFFRSHGPATLRDFVWWSGLPTADARRGIEIIRANPHELDGSRYWTVGSSVVARATDHVHLLPIYDEYLVAYRDRALVPHGPAKIAARPGHSVTFQHALLIDGEVAGTWRTSRGAPRVSITVTPLRRLTLRERREIETGGARHARFLGVPVAMTIE
jgi:hypothetical protein